MDHNKRILRDPTPAPTEPSLEGGPRPYRGIGQRENANSSFLTCRPIGNLLNVVHKLFVDGKLPQEINPQNINILFKTLRENLLEVICFSKDNAQIDLSPENQKKKINELFNRASPDNIVDLARRSLVLLEKENPTSKKILTALEKKDRIDLAEILSSLFCSSMNDIDFVFLLSSFLKKESHLLADRPDELLHRFLESYEHLSAGINELEELIRKLLSPVRSKDSGAIEPDKLFEFEPIKVVHPATTMQQVVQPISSIFENLFSNEEFRAYVKRAQEALGRALHAFADGVSKSKEERRQKRLEYDACQEAKARTRANHVLEDFPELANTPEGVSLMQHKLVHTPSDARVREAQILGERLRLLKETEHKA